MLKLPDLSRPFEVEINTSDYAIGGQLGQRDEDRKLYLIVFFLKKLEGLRKNYSIYDKELLTIIKAFEEQRLYFSGTNYEVQVYMDYKNLKYFTITKVLNVRQGRQLEFLLEFNFQIYYKKGSENVRVDALSKRADYHEEKVAGELLPLL